MTFPAIVQSQTTMLQHSATPIGTTCSIAIASGVTAGNCLLALVAFNTGFSGSFSVPSGWTALHNQTSTRDIVIFAKTSDGTETSLELSRNATIDKGVAAVVLELSGTTPANIEFARGSGNSDAYNLPSLTHSAGAGDNLWLGCMMYTDDVVTGNAAGYTTVADVNVDEPVDSEGVYHRVASRTSTSATEDPGSFTTDNFGPAIGFTVGIAPGSAPASVALDSGNNVRSPGQTVSFTYQNFDGDPTAGPVSVSVGSGVSHSTDDASPFLAGLTWGTDTVDGNGKHSGSGSVTLGSLPSQGNSAKGLPFSNNVQLNITDPGA